MPIFHPLPVLFQFIPDDEAKEPIKTHLPLLFKSFFDVFRLFLFFIIIFLCFALS